MFGKGICDKFANLTFIFINFKFNTLAVLDEKTQKITGRLAHLPNYLLGNIR